MKFYYKRAIRQSFIKKMKTNKVMLLLGSRRVGKTHFIKTLKEELPSHVLMLNGEDTAVAASLNVRTIANYKRLIGRHKIIIIDEAQKIDQIGQILKLMVDEIEGITIVATGSSMFDLSGKLGEPLTGRKITFFLFPLAQMEYAEKEYLTDTNARLEERMIYGNYPELQQYDENTEKSDYLHELVNSYLMKDLLAYEGVRNSQKMMNLLRLVAFQLGNEVSLEELGRQLGISRNTVEKYLDLLSKVFIVHRIPGFSRNLRNEITKSSKWYFYDNGIRNAIIGNYSPLSLRTDTGALWENFLIAERIKYQHYTGMKSHNYFWRTYQQQEIDWVEDRDGQLYAYEIKWKTSKKIKVPSAWKAAYPGSSFDAINPENYLDWISPVE